MVLNATVVETVADADEPVAGVEVDEWGLRSQHQLSLAPKLEGSCDAAGHEWFAEPAAAICRVEYDAAEVSVVVQHTGPDQTQIADERVGFMAGEVMHLWLEVDAVHLCVGAGLLNDEDV